MNTGKQIFYTLITEFQIGNPGLRSFFETYSSSVESRTTARILRQSFARIFSIPALLSIFASMGKGYHCMAAADRNQILY